MLSLFDINEFQFINRELLKSISIYIIAALVIFVILFGIFLIINHTLKKYEKSANNNFITILRKNLGVPFIILIIILSLTIPFSFIQIPEFIIIKANKVLTILIIAIFTWISIRAVQLVKHIVLKRYDIGQKDNLKARKIYTQFKLFERILIFIIIIIAISLALMTFDEIRKIGVSILASAGIAGIILGLAAQKIIAGVLAGIQLAITQPIRIDDVVIVENEWGRIEEINLTFVVVKIWDQRRLILPSTYFIENPFQNWTRTNSEILGTVFIYTDYTVPFDEIRKELTKLLKDCEYWDGKVNVIQVTNTSEKTVELRALVSASDASKAWNLRVFIRENLIKFLQKNYPESLPKSRVIIKNEN